MANTAGYEVLAEIQQSVVKQMLLGAWDNSIVPHSYDVPAGTAFGPYQLADGVADIPKSGLDLSMLPADNAIRLKLGCHAQAEIANPPVPSAGLFDVNADVFVAAPLATLDSTINVGIRLAGLPRSNVQVTLTSGDPIPPLTLTLIQEFVHQQYTSGVIPAIIDKPGVSLGGFSGNAFVEVFDDPLEATRRIQVTQPAADKVKVSIPVHLKITELSPPPAVSPIGVTARLALTAQFESPTGWIIAHVGGAATEIEDFAPASGQEGINYALDKTGAAAMGIDLDAVIKTELKTEAAALAAQIGEVKVMVPTVAQIETFVGDQVWAALLTTGNISVWTPQTPGGTVTVNDVTPKVLADAVAIAMNAGGSADPNAITNQIPAGMSCAIIINGSKVLQIMDEVIHRPEDQGGFGPDFPPKTFNDIDGHDAELTSLSISLADGYIALSGDVTVFDAFCGADVDASFTAKVGLHWEDTPDGQVIRADLLDKDVDMPTWVWIVSFIVGFIVLGIVGGIVTMIIVAVVENIAERIGGAVIQDEVTNQFMVIGAWPQTLEGIGTVTTRFENPVDIDPDGINFPDAFLVNALYASTINALAQANGPYLGPAGSPLAFHGGPSVSQTDFAWQFGDGNAATTISANNTYANGGLYVSKLTTIVNQPGGARTREFALVRVKNVAPHVSAGADITIDEGQEVEFVASFTDQEWVDHHKSLFDFGDDTTPVEGAVAETNHKPAAAGTARAKHAYCREGSYTVTVKIRDDDGCIGEDHLKVTVRNVRPKLDAGEDMFAYTCSPVTLVASFTDPGWCDTHTGTWDFGDCTGPHPAIVRERHKPPAGAGIIAAAHTYQRCGVYLATATVTDDAGASDSGSIAVRVVDIKNREFECGFYNHEFGEVANYWIPYAGGGKGATLSENYETLKFNGEEFVVHGGQRSQRIQSRGVAHAGIYQSVGANPGWDYQISVWCEISPNFGSTCRLGVDPSGGVNPAASGIVWSATSETGPWVELVVRVNAHGHAITIFLESASERGGVVYFDDASLIATPCPLRVRLPQPPVSREEGICVDWQEEAKPRKLGLQFEKKGFVFESRAEEEMQIVVWGEPPNAGKLLNQPRGIQVKLPFVADRVTARVATYQAQQVEIAGFSTTGSKIASTASGAVHNAVADLEIKATGLAELIIEGGRESYVVKLCAYRQVTDSETGHALPNYR